MDFFVVKCRRKKFSLPFLALLVTMIVCCPLSAVFAYGETAESVTVNVTSAGKLPPPVAQRMENSIRGVAEQIILGNDTAELFAHKAQKEKIIREVFDKILIGYSVDNVVVNPGENTLVTVRLVPWSATVKNVTVNTTVEGMPPEIEAMVRRDFAGAENLFVDILEGLPLLAMDWTQGILKSELKKFMEERLPEFRADFDITPTHNATVNLTLYPKLPVTRSVRFFMRSDTVPNFALVGYRDRLAAKANTLLVGVPTGFIQRHKGEITDHLANFMDSQNDFRLLGMKTQVVMEISEEITVTSRSDTSRYRLRLEGWLDVGKKNDDDALKFRLHAGTRLSDVDELFLLADFAPQDVQFSWNVGFLRDINKNISAEIRYDPDKRRPIFGVGYNISPYLRLRYERNRVTKLDEWGLRYKLHDFFGIEYVLNREEGWIRLIGNF